jgi:alkylresorcinol/alkylpyrone synthase
MSLLGLSRLIKRGTMHEIAFDVTDRGPRLMLAMGVPESIRTALGRSVDMFLARVGVHRSDIGFYAVHPGGPRILDAARDALGLDVEQLEHSWAIWQNVGNLSAATVLFILNRIDTVARPPKGSLGLLLAVGPGLTCEQSLLRVA